MGRLTLLGAGVSAVAAVSATWNPSDKAADVTLSNGNLTMTASAGPESVRTGATVTSSQKVYYEIILDNRTFNPRIGFANSFSSLTVALGADFPATSFGLGLNTGTYNCGGSASDATATLPGGMANGDRIGVAFNSLTLLIWFRLNNGAWNSVIGGAQDPAAGTGGLIVAPDTNHPLDPYMAIAEASAGGDQMTANFSSGSWVDTVPSGYTQLAS